MVAVVHPAAPVSHAVVGADWIVVPTKPDDKSLLGLHRVPQRLAALAAQGVPTGQLAGVVLFAIPVSATRIRDQARAELLEAFAHQPVVFEAIIRGSERAAIDQSRHGLVAIEYAHAATTSGCDHHRAGFAGGATSLASDYQALAGEILTRINTRADANPTD